VQAALNALVGKSDDQQLRSQQQFRRTTIVVAHRLSTIAQADLIVAMRHGAIVEKGTHAELMRLDGGYYKQLVTAQQGGLADAS
jgi:ABC-type transport system involved in Fe-S cluster assembly fused permease/ATPase subunit